MACIVLDMELADKNVKKELGVFNEGKVQGFSFRPPKKVLTHETIVLVHKRTARNCVEQWTFGLQ